MTKCAVLLAAIGFITGCASNTGSSARYESGSARITPLPRMQHTQARAALTTPASASETRTTTARTEMAQGDFTEIPLYREQLQVGKREVPKGSVIIRKIVSTQTTNVPVQLRREEIVVERVQANDLRNAQQVAAAGQPFQEREIVVDLNREVPVVEKSTIPAEVVRAQKTVDRRREEIRDTVRSESVNVDRQLAEAEARTPRPASGAPAQNMTGRATSERSDNAELVLHREQLNVGTREVPRGRVVLRKTINSQQVSQPVELRTEDVNIERGPAREVSDRAQAFQSREIVIPLFEEVPVQEKQLQLTEVVRVGKRTETERETISDQLRYEQVQVARSDAAPRGDSEQQVSQGRPAASEAGSARSSTAAAQSSNRFSGQITGMDVERRQVTVRNQQGEERTFTFTERPTLTIKENRAPSLWNFKPGYNVTIGHDGDTADFMMRSDAPEVR